MNRVIRYIALTVFAIGLLFALLLWWVFSPPPNPKPIATAFSLSNVTVINPMTNRSENVILSVRDGTMALNLSEPVGGLIEDYSGMYVLPGFVDMHAHTPPDNALKLTGHYGLLNLAHGVTTIRDAGDIDGTSVPAARKLIRKGAPFPRLESCGPFVSNGVSIWPNTVQLTETTAASSTVEAIASDGHTCIKAYEGLTPELTAALIEAADKSGLDVIGHVPVEYTLEQSGIIDIQHFFGVQPPMSLSGQSVFYRANDWNGTTPLRIQDVVEYVVANDIRNTPTLSLSEGLLGYEDYDISAEAVSEFMPKLFPDVIWHPEHGLPVYRGIDGPKIHMIRASQRHKRDLLKRLSDAGAILHIGTDTGQPFTPPGVSVWREMRLFVEAGVSPEQTLAYATEHARRSLRQEHSILESGSKADFLIFEHDPTETLEHLDSLVAVVIRGELFTRDSLQDAVQDRLDHYNSWPLSEIADWSARRTISTSVSGFD